MNVIGDIAGQYETCMALLKKMPDDEPISLGDMNDRGPKSNKVLEFFMNYGRAVLGNHEHLMLDHLRGTKYYEHGLWLNWNGGSPTMRSFDYEVPEKYLLWLESLPLIIDEDNFILTHAPINPSIPWDMVFDYGTSASDNKCETSILWNRGKPRRIKDKLQLHGHNASRNIVTFQDRQYDEPYAICLDTSRGSKLSGYSTLTGKIYEQDYVQ